MAEEDKKLLGSETKEKLLSKISDVGQSISQRAQEDDPDSWSDEAARLAVGTAKTAGAIVEAPVIKQVLQVADIPFYLARQSAGAVLEHGFGVDPFYGQAAVGVGEFFVGGKALTSAAKRAGNIYTGTRRVGAILSKADTAAATATRAGVPSTLQGMGIKPENVGLFNKLSRKINNPDQLELFPDPLRNIIPGKNPRWPFGESLEEVGKKGFNPVTIQSLRDAGVSENLIFTMKNWNVTGKKAASGVSRAAAAAVERPAFSNALFELRRLQLLPIFEKGFLNAGTTLKPKLHHIAGLKASLPLYDGIKIGKGAYNKLNSFLENEGIFPGHHMENFLMLSDESHLAIHRFMDDIIGPSGEVFFNAERKARIRKSTFERLQVAKEYAAEVKRSKQLALDIHEQYKKLYGITPDDPDTIIRIMREAEELYKKIGPRYSNESLRKIIQEVEGYYQKELLDDKWRYQMWKANQEEIKATGRPLPGMVTPEVDKIFDPPKNPKKKLK